MYAYFAVHVFLFFSKYSIFKDIMWDAPSLFVGGDPPESSVMLVSYTCVTLKSLNTVFLTCILCLFPVIIFLGLLPLFLLEYILK